MLTCYFFYLKSRLQNKCVKLEISDAQKAFNQSSNNDPVCRKYPSKIKHEYGPDFTIVSCVLKHNLKVFQTLNFK